MFCVLISVMCVCVVSSRSSKDTSKSYRGPVSDQLLSCICTLCLFVRADARLAVSHPTHILPYLDMPWDVSASAHLLKHHAALSDYTSEPVDEVCFLAACV